MEQIFFTEKDQIGKTKLPIQTMAVGGAISPQKPIETMTLVELQKFMQALDPIKSKTMNWSKGSTRRDLRIQVKNNYDS